MKPVIIISTLNPDEKLINLVQKLKKSNLPIVIINDGSKKECTDIFETLKLWFQCDILTHEKIWERVLPLKQESGMFLKDTTIAAVMLLQTPTDSMQERIF